MTSSGMPATVALTPVPSWQDDLDMLAGLDSLPSVWNPSSATGAPACTPMSQQGGLSSLLADPLLMSSPLDAFPETFPVPPSMAQQQSLPYWNLPLPELTSSSQQWLGGSSQSQAELFASLEPYNLEAAIGLPGSGPSRFSQRSDGMAPSFPWTPSGQSWGAQDQQLELATDTLLPEGQLQPLGSSSFMRRGFSAEALPRQADSPVDTEALHRPHSLDTERRLGRSEYAPASFHSSYFNMPASSGMARQEQQGSLMDIEDDTARSSQHARQLKPRLETDYLVTKHTSVLSLDKSYGRMQAPSQASALLDMPDIPTASGAAHGLGSRRLTYRVRSNALSEIPLSKLQPKASAAPTILKEAQPAASQDVPDLARGRPEDEEESAGKDVAASLPTTSAQQLEEASQVELSGIQTAEGPRVLVDPHKLAQFFRQLHTIQAKIASLQQERVANLLRERSLEQAEAIMEDALQALSGMKSAGASLEDREAKLISTEAALQSILHSQAGTNAPTSSDRQTDVGGQNEPQTSESQAMDEG